jgi:hypothetical protein
MTDKFVGRTKSGIPIKVPRLNIKKAQGYSYYNNKKDELKTKSNIGLNYGKGFVKGLKDDIKSKKDEYVNEGNNKAVFSNVSSFFKPNLNSFFEKEGDENPIIKMINKLEDILNKNKDPFKNIITSIDNNKDTLHLIPRNILVYITLFIIISEVILMLITPVLKAIPFIGEPLVDLLNFFVLPKEIYFLGYGFFKMIINIFILFIVIKIITYGGDQGINDSLSISITNLISVLGLGIIMSIIGIVSLFSYIIHLSVLNGFYKIKCNKDSEDNEEVISNKLILIDILKYGILIIGMISFIYYVLRENLKGTTNTKIPNLPLYMLLIPGIYLFIDFIIQFIEDEITNVIVNSVGKMDENYKEIKNCVTQPGSCENAGDSTVTNLIKLIVYTVISVIIIKLQLNDSTYKTKTNNYKTLEDHVKNFLNFPIMAFQKSVSNKPNK